MPNHSIHQIYGKLRLPSSGDFQRKTHMDPLRFLPISLRERSISKREIVLPLEAALQALETLERQGVQILGWEGWVKCADGRVGHGSAPQGTVSLSHMSASEAAAFCRSTMRSDAAQWAIDNPATTDQLHFCITVKA